MDGKTIENDVKERRQEVKERLRRGQSRAQGRLFDLWALTTESEKREKEEDER